MELLSPAGGKEALTAAVQNGADAVYLGYTAFGARSFAGNFDRAGLEEAIGYAHERDKKIFVTVNTLAKQSELDDVADLLELLCKLNADAAIVQDMGVARMARERFPQMSLHASTQMTVHNAQGAQVLKALGFERVVPARECSLAQLGSIANVGLEVEAFVHGALCVSVSGQCLFSGFAGGRSGNRGRCAQPCRMPYTMPSGERGYLLSTRDLMLLEQLPQLRDAGVYSLKIEGRMKRPEYVAVVTRVYREALDALQHGEKYTLSEANREALLQIYNRGGFTQGYVMEQNHAALLSWEKNGHWGIPVGTIERLSPTLAHVRLTKDIKDGDGLQLQGQGQDVDITYSGPDLPKGETAKVHLRDAEKIRILHGGDAVVRLTSVQQMEAARASYARENIAIPVDMTLVATVGDVPMLTISDGVHSVCVSDDVPVSPAQNRPIDETTARRQLEKTGGTPYVLRALQVAKTQGFVSASTLNALRREGLARLAAQRIARTPLDVFPAKDIALPGGTQAAQLSAQTDDLAQAQALLQAGADWVYWRATDYREAALECAWRACEAAVRGRIVFVLPQMAYTRELEQIAAWVRRAEGLGRVAIANIGQLGLDMGDVVRVTDAPMHVMNVQSAAFLFEQGIAQVTLSQEMNSGEMRALTALGGVYEVIVYGRAQLMLLAHCTQRVKAGERTQDTACARCEGQSAPRTLTDRQGYTFVQIRERLPEECFVRLYNGITTDMARHFERIRALGCSIRVCFTDEGMDERIETIQAYRALLSGKADPRDKRGRQTTSGHLLRGVE